MTQRGFAPSRGRKRRPSRCRNASEKPQISRRPRILNQPHRPGPDRRLSARRPPAVSSRGPSPLDTFHLARSSRRDVGCGRRSKAATGWVAPLNDLGEGAVAVAVTAAPRPSGRTTLADVHLRQPGTGGSTVDMGRPGFAVFPVPSRTAHRTCRLRPRSIGHPRGCGAPWAVTLQDRLDDEIAGVFAPSSVQGCANASAITAFHLIVRLQLRRAPSFSAARGRQAGPTSKEHILLGPGNRSRNSARETACGTARISGEQWSLA